MRLGISTDSHDADGQVTGQRPVPALTEADIEAAFAKFRGDIQQVPPMVSAIKHEGTPLYKLARKGKTIEREPRLVHIYDLRLLQLALPDVQFRVTCTKGTYVRTLCHDIGETLGCGAHLAGLRRTRSGAFDVKDARPLDELLALNREQLPVIPILKLVKTP
jgi:tRNA pseudouridine55 synthase